MSREKITRLALAALLLAGIGLLATQREALDAAALAAWFRALPGWAAPLLFIGLYALGAVFFLPGSVLTLAGGAMFGPWMGTLYSLSGATLGALLSFLVSRHLAADWVRRRSGARLTLLIEGVEDEGWRFVAFTRLVPLFPFNLLNYALGLTRIPFLAYGLTTFVCMIPGALAYTWLGHAGKEAATGGEGLIRNVLIALALLAAALFLPRLVARLRGAPMLPVETLRRQLDAGDEVLLLDVRPAADFNGEQGHIAGAMNIPLEDLPARLLELEASRQRPVRLVCRTDRRSAQAARQLASAGFSDARVIRGGMTAWLAKGWPVERAP